MKRLKKTVKNFDILNGSTVIYQRRDVLATIPPIDPLQITRKDFDTFFNTRAYTALCAVPANKKFMNFAALSLSFLGNQLAKGLLAVLDCKLIADHKFYCSSYQERVSFFRRNTQDSEAAALFDWAFLETRPHANSYDAEFGLYAYERLCKYFREDMNSYLGLYYGLTPSLANYYWLRFMKFDYMGRWILSRIIPRLSYIRKRLLVNYLQYILIMTSDHEMEPELFSAQADRIGKILRKLGVPTSGVVTRSLAVEFVKSSR